MKLFVYGTLMDDALVVQLTGRRLAKRTARLHAFRRITAENGYPNIVPDIGAVVDGYLLCDVDTTALQAFDAYEEEGRLYRRTDVVVTSDGRATHAQAYVGISTAGV